MNLIDIPNLIAIVCEYLDFQDLENLDKALPDNKGLTIYLCKNYPDLIEDIEHTFSSRLCLQRTFFERISYTFRCEDCYAYDKMCYRYHYCKKCVHHHKCYSCTRTGNNLYEKVICAKGHTSCYLNGCKKYIEICTACWLHNRS